MKKLKMFALALLATLVTVNFTACSDDDDPVPTPEPVNPTPDPTPEQNYYFDVWVTDGETTGMGSGSNDIYVKNVEDISVDEVVKFDNSGVEVGSKLYQESIIKGGYYYQIPQDKDRFGKYQVLNEGGVKTIAEVPFATNTYQDRRYTHAWLNDDTFVVLAANGDKNDVIYTKIQDKGSSLAITEEGTLNLPAALEAIGVTIKTFSTSGLATYRKQDGKIVYFFCENGKGAKKAVYVAVINASDMSVEGVDKAPTGEKMSGTAYGELLQDKLFYTEAGDIYLPVWSDIEGGEKASTCAYSRIVRVKAGENKFDQNWIGFNGDQTTGKITTSTYLGNGKALLYVLNPEYTGASASNTLSEGWGREYANAYYGIYDIATDKIVEISYNGQKLPYNKGTFSQRTVVKDGKAFIGSNPEGSEPTVYVYDIASGNVTKGITIGGGLEFSRLVVLDK